MEMPNNENTKGGDKTLIYLFGGLTLFLVIAYFSIEMLMK